MGLEQLYTEKHPSVRQAKQELQQLQTNLDAEVVAAVDSNAVTLNSTQAQLLKNYTLAAVNLAVADAGE